MRRIRNSRSLHRLVDGIIQEALILEKRQSEIKDKNPLSAPVKPFRKNANSRADKTHSMTPKNKLAAPYGAYNIVRAGIANGSPTITDKSR